MMEFRDWLKWLREQRYKAWKRRKEAKTLDDQRYWSKIIRDLQLFEMEEVRKYLKWTRKE